MALPSNPAEIVLFITSLILLLQNIHDEMQNSMIFREEEVSFTVDHVHNILTDMSFIITMALQDFRLGNARFLLGEDIGYWVKPRSKTWFSIFLMTVYDDDRWVANFRLTKQALFSLSDVLAPHIMKQDTKFREVIPVKVRVAVALFKLVQGSSFLIVSELFAVGVSTVSKILREVVIAVNIVFRDEIQWPNRERALVNMEDFKSWCGLPGVIGAIDGTHIAISKPIHFSEDYYYFKSGGYSVVCQAVVDRNKRFLDVCVGLPGSVNDSRVLRCSGLFRKASVGNLIQGPAISQDGFTPYILGDKGYPLLPWLMTPYRERRHSFLEALYQRRHKRGRSVVEHAFGVLKGAFRELLHKSELHVAFIPDVVMCCCYLHNVLLGQDEDHVERLLEQLRNEGMENEDTIEEPDPPEVPILEEPGILRQAQTMREDLGAFIGRQRNIAL